MRSGAGAGSRPGSPPGEGAAPRRGVGGARAWRERDGLAHLPRRRRRLPRGRRRALPRGRPPLPRRRRGPCRSALPACSRRAAGVGPALEPPARCPRGSRVPGGALASARRAVDAAPGPVTFGALGRAHLARGEWDEALRALRSAATAGGGPAAIKDGAQVLLLAHRLEEAEAEGQRLLAGDVPPYWRLGGYALVIQVRAMQGKRRDLLRLLEGIPAAERAANPVGYHRLALEALARTGAGRDRLRLEARGWGSALAAFPLAYAGDLARSAELARGLPPGPDRELHEGLVAWRRDDRVRAVARLEAAARGSSMTMSRRLASSFLGEVLSELGRDEETVRAMRELRAPTLQFPQYAFVYPRSLLFTARSLERLGRRHEALQEAEALLRLWRSADPDLPELREARALRARLAGAR
ncbi:Tetratricopeptide TPR_4 [Anaeromyxobacter sp. Fw109-5]|nr:Tetratricopeptide TPR_4 [Anaeromyxobacter sp. Fw109-5]